ncbi:MAG: glycosyltransferase [Erysipelotrichaceae bacterium]|nr:glycosyltransferase [Erysipelotrichaceae bacterium]MDY5252421.1 glycosyltransferase [Erysipelotrichaceae bacterium]
MSILVSIVVPIYNVEKYLSKCIDSIIAQTYQNLEIILVNDGSKDNSLAICQNYANKDARVKIIDKVNGGLSDARNAGIQQAKGEFVAFIDSDDFIKAKMIEEMLAQIQITNSDICVCDMEYLYDDGRLDFAGGGAFDQGSVKEDSELMVINNSACNKLYRLALFNDWLFPVGKYYEDLATVPVLLYKAKKICKVNEAFYVYYQRSGSIAHSANKKIFEIYEAINRCIEYVKINNSDPRLLAKLQSLYILHGLDLTTLRIKEFDDKAVREEYLAENMQYLRKYYPNYRNDERYKETSFKKKVIFKLLEKGKYKLVLKIYDR